MPTPKTKKAVTGKKAVSRNKPGRPKSTNAKKGIIQIRLNTADRKDIKVLSKHLNLSSSEMIRLVVKKYKNELKNQGDLFE